MVSLESCDRAIGERMLSPTGNCWRIASAVAFSSAVSSNTTLIVLMLPSFENRY